MEKLDGGGWTFFEGKQHMLELLHPSTVHLEIRCAEGAVLSAVTLEGELLFLEQGSDIRYSGVVTGFKGLDIEPSGPFACRLQCLRTDSVVDPVPAVMHVAVPLDPVKAAVQEAIRQQLWELRERGMLEDAEVEELLQEMQEDELEFEDEEPDPFGLGHTEVAEARGSLVGPDAPSSGEQNDGDPEASQEIVEAKKPSAARKKKVEQRENAAVSSEEESNTPT